MKSILITTFLGIVTTILLYTISMALGIPLEFTTLGCVSYLLIKDIQEGTDR